MPTVAVVSLGRHSRHRHSGERHRFSLGLFLFLGRCGCALDPLLSVRRRQSTWIGLDNGGHRAAALNIQVVCLLQKKIHAHTRNACRSGHENHVHAIPFRVNGGQIAPDE